MRLNFKKTALNEKKTYRISYSKLGLHAILVHLNNHKIIDNELPRFNAL